MTTISSKPPMDAEELRYLQATSDHTRGTGSTPSSNYMTVEEVKIYMDKASEQAAEFGRYLRATGQQSADGYNYGASPPSAADFARDQQHAVESAKTHITLIQSTADALSKSNLDWLESVAGKDRVASYVATVTATDATARSSLVRLQNFATAHLGLQGQLFTQDGSGNYQLGAFILSSSGADNTIRTGSNGATQIAHKDEEFQPYNSLHSLTFDSSAKAPLNITA